jgi:hypothetical protein
VISLLRAIVGDELLLEGMKRLARPVGERAQERLQRVAESELGQAIRRQPDAPLEVKFVGAVRELIRKELE